MDDPKWICMGKVFRSYQKSLNNNVSVWVRFDIRRYCPKVSADAQWVKERSHEAYAKNYSMVFPHDEPLAGRNMKKVPLPYEVLLDTEKNFLYFQDPLHEELEKAGCVYQVILRILYTCQVL